MSRSAACLGVLSPVLLLVTLSACAGSDGDEAAPQPTAVREQVQEQAIAFARRAQPGSEQELWAVNPDGSGRRQLTDNPPRQGDDSSPVWSRDGRWIAFVGTRHEPSDVRDAQPAEEIYIVRRDGSDVERLTTNTDLDIAPNWLPDGRVAFVSCHFREEQEQAEKPHCSLVAIEPRTRARSELADVQLTYDLHVSPNGRRIVYASIGNPHFQTAELHVSDLDGGNHQQLTDNDTGDGSPAWSPDGTKIVFVSNRSESARCFWHDCAGFTTEIYVMDADGSDVKRLTETPHEESGPAWSPDGTKIVYSRILDDNAEQELYVMNADGTCQTRLIPGSWDMMPDWYGPAGAAQKELQC